MLFSLQVAFAEAGYVIKIWGDIDIEYGWEDTGSNYIWNNETNTNTTLIQKYNDTTRTNAVGSPTGSSQTHSTVIWAWGDLDIMYIWGDHTTYNASDSEIVERDNENFVQKTLTEIESGGTTTNETITETTNVTITNIEPCGEYVFVGRKEYIFRAYYEINTTTYPNYEASLNFTDDADETYIFVYNATSERTTVTSPNEGVSGAARDVETTGNDVKIDFYLMFHEPVADTINTTLYLRAESSDRDTGWEDGNETFSIYNIGGATELTDSGTAGRVDGGDAFEIYAGDTRTPSLIDNYGFEINNWGTRKSVDNQREFLEDISEDWIVHNPFNYWSGTDKVSIFPKSGRPDSEITGGPTASSSDRGYNDGRWALYCIDENTASDRFTYVEKQFRRSIEPSDDEIVYVQWYLMTPKAGNSTDPGYGGEVRVLDDSIHISGSANMAAQIRLNTTGYIQAFNGTDDWVDLQTISDYTWYNVTAALNVTGDTYDVYVDGVLKADDIGFPNSAADDLEYVWIGRTDSGITSNEFYCDDVDAWTDFSGDYGGWAEVQTVHKHLQHWRMDFDWRVDDQRYVQGPTWAEKITAAFSETYEEEGYIMLGWDVCIDGTWNNDILYANITIKDGVVDKTRNWVLFSVDWYNYNTLETTETLYGLFEGHSGILTDEGAADVIGFHWDIWFNQLDSSTWLGGRLNTEYYGVSDKSPAMFFWTSNWKPMSQDRSYSDCFVRLTEDGSSTVKSAKDVSMVRSWAYVYRTNVSTFHYKITNLQTQQFRTADAEFTGIETPEAIPTKVPTTPGGFISSALGAVFKRVTDALATRLTYGLLAIWQYFVGFMDTLAAWLGSPNAFSNFIGWVGDVMSYAVTAMSNLATNIADVFSFMAEWSGNALYVVDNIATGWIEYWQQITTLMQGGFGTGYNIWQEFILPFMPLLPTAWVLMVYYEYVDHGADAAIRRVNQTWNFLWFFVDIGLRLGQFVVTLVVGIIESIPVIE